MDKRHEVDDQDATRVHEELLSIYNNFVAVDESKRPMFLQTLGLLRPCIQGQSRLEEWWNLAVGPAIDSVGLKKVEIQRASNFLVSVLDYDVEGENHEEDARISTRFLELLLAAWLKRAAIPKPDQDTLTVEDAYIARQEETVLIEFGRRKPKV